MWKVSKYGVISGGYFPFFNPNTGKYWPEITPHLDTSTQCIEENTAVIQEFYIICEITGANMNYEIIGFIFNKIIEFLDYLVTHSSWTVFHFPIMFNTNADTSLRLGVCFVNTLNKIIPKFFKFSFSSSDSVFIVSMFFLLFFIILFEKLLNYWGASFPIFLVDLLRIFRRSSKTEGFFLVSSKSIVYGVKIE